MRDVLNRFVSAWASHDLNTLSDLFAEQFEYKINGKLRFSEKAALRHYWATNKLRQLDLEIKTFCETFDDDAGTATVSFGAIFYHPRRGAITVITGTMTIEVGDTGKIRLLDEHYAKLERATTLYRLHIASKKYLQPVARAIQPTLNRVGSVLRRGGQALLFILFGLGLLVLIYVNFLHQATPILSQEVVGAIRPSVPYFFAALYLIHQLLPFFRSRVLPDIEIKKIEQDDDLLVIERELRGADNVKILSGDFSFIETNTALEASLRDLAFRGKLELYSYKSREVVVEELRLKSASNEILMRLVDTNKIFFDCSVHAKCTLVETGGLRKLLFRFSKAEATRNVLYIGVMRSRENTQYLLTIYQRMFASLRPPN